MDPFSSKVKHIAADVSPPLPRPKSRKRYISTGSEDAQFTPAKTAHQGDEEVDQIWRSMLEAVEGDNFEIQVRYHKALVKTLAR